MLRELDRVLVIEDDVSLRTAVSRVVERLGDVTLSAATTAAEAKALLAKPPPPDLIITDIRLPDDSALPVLEFCQHLSPTPIVIAISGKASAHEAFKLAKVGVSAYLPKPFSIAELLSAIEKARREVPNLEPVISAAVGQVPMLEVQKEVRRVMMKEALARTEGSRSGAARLLKVTRQAVQQMLRSEAEAESAKRTASPEPPPRTP